MRLGAWIVSHLPGWDHVASAWLRNPVTRLTRLTLLYPQMCLLDRLAPI
jgi:hypothetical protein